MIFVRVLAWAGALILGGVAYHEFAYASSHEYAYGPAKVIAWGAVGGATLAVALLVFAHVVEEFLKDQAALRRHGRE